MTAVKEKNNIMRVDQLENKSDIDAWLFKNHEMYRILIPKDLDCLFKAVAELVSTGTSS